MCTSTYYEKMYELANSVDKSILDLNAVRRKPRAPTAAFSDFMINIGQGEWAEEILKKGLIEVIGRNYNILKYGKSDKKIAGNDGFKSFYELYQKELENIGKRPDLVILPKGANDGLGDISKMELTSQEKIVKQAILGIEVRSSSQLLQKYNKKNENTPTKSLSFTPKIEDIRVILKWIKTYNIPHYFAQVFFDDIYMISFKTILEIMNTPAQKPIWSIEKNKKNSYKSTIHIAVTNGVKIGEINTLPDHNSERANLDSGRLIHYVSFKNGEIKLDKNIVNKIIKDAKVM